MKSKILSAALPFFMMGLHVAQAAIHQPRERVEVAFVLDTTGSMGDL